MDSGACNAVSETHREDNKAHSVRPECPVSKAYGKAHSVLPECPGNRAHGRAVSVQVNKAHGRAVAVSAVLSAVSKAVSVKEASEGRKAVSVEVRAGSVAGSAVRRAG